MLDGTSMQIVANVDMEPSKGKAWAIHRVDLHNELLRLACSATEPGKVVKLHLSSETVSASTEGTIGKIVLRDGSTRTADLIVAADGLKSVLRGVVIQAAAQPTPTGLSAFRFLIDTQKLKADERLSAMLEKTLGGANILADTRETTKERHMVWYGCRKYATASTPREKNIG